MKARIYLFSIVAATIFAIFSYGKLTIFQNTQIQVLNKIITLNSEMIILLIVLSTLLLVLLVGLTDKTFYLFSSQKKRKEEKE